MIPKQTKKDFVGIFNLSRRMTPRERDLLWESIEGCGVIPVHRKNYGKTLTKQEWNIIVRPALLVKMEEKTDFEPDKIRVVKIVTKIDTKRRTARSDLCVTENGDDKMYWTPIEAVSTARCLISFGEKLLEHISPDLYD